MSYVWDGSTSLNRRGRLRSVTDGAGSSSFEYDVMGRISRSVRTTLGTTLTADYLYTGLGGVKQVTFGEVNPANYSLVYGYDDQGRQRTLHDGGGTAFVIGHSMIFDGFGAFEETIHANNISESTLFNNRLQPSRLTADRFSDTLMDLEYDYAFFGANNGNIRLITDHLDSSRNRVYLYDALNRLEGVDGAPWEIDYAYDRFGNRLSAQGTASTPNFAGSSLSYEPGTNRVQGWEYDAAGNLLDDGLRRHWRDGEGRITGVGPTMPSSPPAPGPGDGRSALSPRTGSPSTAYLYDYNGRQAAKQDGSGGGRIYFWDEAIGEVIWEFPLGSAQQDVVRGWFNGRLVAENDTRPGGGLRYFIRDHLGSTQVTADFFTGNLICSSFCHPFGQSADSSGCDAHVRKFTQKERDPETGLDYFGARYCDSVAGRFLSPDPLLESAKVTDPRSWNRYAYTRNNPMNRIDLDGLEDEKVSDPLDFLEGVATAGLREALDTAKLGVEVAIFGSPFRTVLPKTQLEKDIESSGEFLRRLAQSPQQTLSESQGQLKEEFRAGFLSINQSPQNLQNFVEDLSGGLLMGIVAGNVKIFKTGFLRRLNVDAEGFKRSFLGDGARISRFDIGKDKKTGQVILTEKSTGRIIQTDVSFDDFVRLFQKEE